MYQVASAYSGCVVERMPGPAIDVLGLALGSYVLKAYAFTAPEGETLLLVAGPVTSRIQAVQAGYEECEIAMLQTHRESRPLRLQSFAAPEIWSLGRLLRLFGLRQDFMSKTDRAHMEGIAVAKSIDGEIVGQGSTGSTAAHDCFQRERESESEDQRVRIV